MQNNRNPVTTVTSRSLTPRAFNVAMFSLKVFTKDAREDDDSWVIDLNANNWST